jgi:hypothetical protein
MTKWIAAIATAITCSVLTTIALIYIFEGGSKIPRLVSWFIGAGVPVLIARSVYKHFQKKELNQAHNSPTQKKSP